MQIDDFIKRWTAGAGGAERANYQMFLTELCDLICVSRPDQNEGGGRNDYVFERAVRPRESDGGTAPKRIDLYKRNAFILEAKQSRLPGKEKALPGQQLPLPEIEIPRGARTSVRGWDVMMQNARRQAEGYVFLLDADHPAPPFIVVCDVGHCLELYADFTGTGRAYTQFPDRNGYRIFMEDLRDEKVRQRLANVWMEPHTLDPAKNAVRVTRKIAERLAAVSKALEEKKAKPEDVAHFLMRCLFTMFAEDTDLLPKGSFTKLLEKSVDDPSHFAHRLKALWTDMERGNEFNAVIDARVRHFNGGLFKDTNVFELGREEIGELLQAARADWREVDPAIFGTLLEQALDKDERRRLGAHYTPRAYVQRLVDVTIMEPLRADWQAALTKAEQAKEDGDDKGAREIVRGFLRQLCATRVLDPACGTGNFLYVSLELMKQLEGEVLETLTKLGDAQADLALEGLTVDPHLFLGLELNPRAAAIAELVVWIGYLQWHYRNTTGHPAEPILRAFSNINFGKREGYDAVLTWDGAPLPHVEVRDGVRLERYPNPRRPAWPEAEFIVGNPPFIGKGAIIRSALGSSYVEALWATYPEMNESADFVMYWWDRAADALTRPGARLRRFGLVTTNSIDQTFNRRVVQRHLTRKPAITILYAIPNHPWTKVTKDAASVRISMTVAEAGNALGTLRMVETERGLDTDDPYLHFRESRGRINADLTVGADVSSTRALRANMGMASMGPALGSRGFVVSGSEKQHLDARLNSFERNAITALRNGDDLLYAPRGIFVPVLVAIETEEELRNHAPNLYQLLRERVYPKRSIDPDPRLRRYWWRFRRSNEDYFALRDGLSRYVATVETAKHRIFFFVDGDVLIEHGCIAFGTASGASLAILSSRTHVTWSLAAGGTLEDRPRYNKVRTFDPFPFPSPDEALSAQLSKLGEELDATRKRVQVDHPDLTLTGLYNVLEKVKAPAPLTAAEEDVKTRGLVLILKDLHEEIDRLTARAYGWAPDLTDEQILGNLVALNAERAKEEAAGHVRWLRPDYQIPRFAKDAKAKPGDLDLVDTPTIGDKTLPAFPKDRYEHPLAVEHALLRSGRPLNAPELSRLFKNGGKKIEARIAQVLTTLERYGRVAALEDGRFGSRRNIHVTPSQGF